MTGNVLVPGTRVRQINTQQEGVVVPDIFGNCGGDHILVEFDGEKNLSCRAVPKSDVLAFEVLRPNADSDRCKACALQRHGECRRYAADALLTALGTKKEIPSRMYPHCKDSVAAAVGRSM